MSLTRWMLCAVSPALVVVAVNVAAQPAPSSAPTGANTVGIQRHMHHDTAGVGVFSEDVHAPPPPPRGEVGGTGAVGREQGPAGNLRGSTTPEPGAIDLSQPIGPGDVARIVRSQEPRFRPCYDRARATRPTLAGRIAMRFVVGRTGALTGVDVTGIPQAPEVATCIRGELAQLHLPRPQDGVLPFSYAMNFSPPPPPPRGRGRAPRAPHR